MAVLDVLYMTIVNQKTTVLNNGTFNFNSRSLAPIALALLQLMGIPMNFIVWREEKPGAGGTIECLYFYYRGPAQLVS